MYISSISVNDVNLYNEEVTIDLKNVTPHEKSELIGLCRCHSDIYINPLINYNFFNNKSIKDSTLGIKVTKVIYHNPATIVFWSDGTKTVVKCSNNDIYDPEKGFYIACAKKLFGNNYAAVGRINKALEMAEVKNEDSN